MTEEIVLLADDDEEDCLLLNAAIREAGVSCRVLRAREGSSVVPMARSGPTPSVFVLDLHMPGKNGLDVLSELRADAAFAAIPVVILTGSNSEEHVRQARERGASAFWRKPKKFSELVALVETLRAYLAHA